MSLHTGPKFGAGFTASMWDIHSSRNSMRTKGIVSGVHPVPQGGHAPKQTGPAPRVVPSRAWPRKGDKGCRANSPWRQWSRSPMRKRDLAACASSYVCSFIAKATGCSTFDPSQFANSYNQHAPKPHRLYTVILRAKESNARGPS